MLQLVIANKLYSSWSLRPWMVLHAFGIPFSEHVVALRQPDTKERIANVSPSGKVPVLMDDGIAVWESLAIIEFLAETHPDLEIWPRDRAARAHARAISNEMHGGFMPLRQTCPMNLAKRFKTPPMTDELAQNVARIEEIWQRTRNSFRAAGPFLFGAFSAADAMYAPVVTRLDTYQIAVSPPARTYMDAVLSHPSFIAWKAAALAEPWTISDYEAGHEAVETFR